MPVSPDPDSFASRESALRSHLEVLRDPQERLAWVVEQARHRPPFPPDWRTEEHRVPGCAARLWLVPRQVEGHCRFAGDSDSAILKAMTGLICDLYDGLPPADVARAEPEFLARTGLESLLTENRRRTVRRVIEVIREFALRHRAAEP